MKRNAMDDVAVLKAATREAHIAAQELASVIREARKLQADLKGFADVTVEKAMEPVIEAKFAEFNKAMNDGIEMATQAVFDRFDTIRDALLGENQATRRRGLETIPELAEQYRANQERRKW